MTVEIPGIVLELSFQETDRFIDLALFEILASADFF
jgi:hypothetical protein